MPDSRRRPGFTFSKLQADYLGIPWQRAFTDALDELAPALVRLGAYWAECEPRPGQLDFTVLDWLLDQAQARGVPVLLTAGMKAPRWPEYFLPSWLEPRLTRPAWLAHVSDDRHVREATLDFIAAVVRRYRHRDVVSYWQVENEPPERAGPRRWRIGPDFLASEIALVRRLDGRRPIVVNVFVRTDPLALLPPWRQRARARAARILGLADILGLDVYPALGARALGQDVSLHWRWWQWEVLLRDLQGVAAARGAPVWIVEAQAEPWEPGRVVYTDAAASRSVTPRTALATFQRLQDVGFGTVLLWGVEHWYARRALHGDATWLQTMRRPFEAAPGTCSSSSSVWP